MDEISGITPAISDEEAQRPMLLAAWMLYGGAMLRVEIQGSPETSILKLEGRLAGDDARHTRTLVRHCLHGARLVVDLTEVTFIDSVGEDVLSFYGRFGAEFVAQTSYTVDVCERLHLHLAKGGALDKDTAAASRKNSTRRRTNAHQPEN